ncbi:CTP synthase [Yokenella regensburgei]|uniref:CTP synthase (glutamine hydrolyzing) n=2 Tax=Yokenella regensburgei TaxID=158877 RepID=A0AB38FQX0_9ENTR|nr:CTP synthase [Yokenella regensburgei]SQA67405.1 CTP synthase [Yokenella regensburgei]SUQ05839.1 CTP synthase [Yokenella regensburgei]
MLSEKIVRHKDPLMENVTPKSALRIALVGDYNAEVLAHQAIPLAIDDAAAVLGFDADYDWLMTQEIQSEDNLVGYDAIWLVPASPYQSVEGALTAIRYARENAIPFLGTCGGFQHAIIEYARNVMGWEDAAHAETDHEGRMVIAPLTCSLVETSDTIELRANTLIHRSYGRDSIQEGYHCNYGISPLFAAELDNQPLRVTGWDEEGEIRAVELMTHPFFVATLFQHERNALAGRPAPLVQAFLHAARQ